MSRNFFKYQRTKLSNTSIKEKSIKESKHLYMHIQFQYMVKIKLNCTLFFSSFSKRSKALNTLRQELSSQEGRAVLSIAIIALTTCHKQVFCQHASWEQKKYYRCLKRAYQKNSGNLFPVKSYTMKIKWYFPVAESSLKIFS